MTPPPKKLKAALPIIGWRERVSLPELGVGPFTAKIDTGARSAALHAEDLTPNGKTLSFSIRVEDKLTSCSLPLKGARRVKSTSGHSEERWVVETTVAIGPHRYATEITLTNRTDMGVPMLLGRLFLRGRFLVNAGNSFLQSKRKSSHP